jgi:hypothetical protein
VETDDGSGPFVLRYAALGLVWSLYLVTVVAACVEIASGLEEFRARAMAFENGILLAAAWGLCGVWSLIFPSGGARRRENNARMAFSATVLVAATMLSMGSSASEAAWRGNDPLEVLVAGVPSGMLAVWLVVASGLNVATVVWGVQPTERALRWTTIVAVGREKKLAPWAAGFAVVVSVFCFTIPDPVGPLVIAWALVNMRGTIWTWVAIEVSLVSSLAAFVSAVTGVFPWA